MCDCVIAKREGLKSFTLPSTKDRQEQILFQTRSLLTEQTFIFVTFTNVEADCHVQYIRTSVAIQDYDMASLKILVTGATGYM